MIHKKTRDPDYPHEHPFRMFYAPDGRDGDCKFPVPSHWIRACSHSFPKKLEDMRSFMAAIAPFAELAGEKQIAADLRQGKGEFVIPREDCLAMVELMRLKRRRLT